LRHAGIVLAAPLANAARRIAPWLVTTLFEAAPWPGFQLAMPRAAAPFDPGMDDGAGLDILDFVLRARAPVAVWDCPLALKKPTNQEAGFRFAEKWIQAAAF
jgi:hypothetical protein